MALQEIINTILDEAKKEVSVIQKEAAVKVSEINEAGEKKLTSEKAKLNDLAEAEAAKIIEKAKFEANIAERNKVVSTKQKVVDRVFEAALEQLKDLDDKKYQTLIASLISQLPEGEDAEIVSVSGRESLTKKVLQDSGKKISFSNEVVEGVGGFVYRSKDIEVNNRFEELLVGAREDVDIEVSIKLFS